MAQFMVDIEGLKKDKERYEAVLNALTDAARAINSVALGLLPIGLGAVSAAVETLNVSVLKNKTKVMALRDALNSIQLAYLNSEHEILGLSASGQVSANGPSLGFGVNIGNIFSLDGNNSFLNAMVDGSFFAQFFDADGNFNPRINMSGEMTASLLDFEYNSSLFNFINSNLTGSLFNSENFFRATGQIFDANGNFNPLAYLSARGSNSILNFQNTTTIDWFTNEITGIFGRVDYNACIIDRLFDENGRFSPANGISFSLNETLAELTVNNTTPIGGKYDTVTLADINLMGGIGISPDSLLLGGYGTATGLEFENIDRLGRSYLGVFNRTYANVGTATAIAGGGIGNTSLDGTGGFTAYGGLGAHAAGASAGGELGVTIMGVDIGVGPSVEAYSAGAEMDWVMTDGVFEANLEGAFGVGGGLHLRVDVNGAADAWSDFKEDAGMVIDTVSNFHLFD